MNSQEKISNEKLVELVQNLSIEVEDLKTRITDAEKSLKKLKRGQKWV